METGVEGTRPEELPEFESASGGGLKITGAAIIKFFIKDRPFYIRGFVSPSISCGAILGAATMVRMRMKLDFDNKTVSFDGSARHTLRMALDPDGRPRFEQAVIDTSGRATTKGASREDAVNLATWTGA